MAKKPQHFAPAQMSNKAVSYMAAGSVAHQVADFETQKQTALDKIKKNKQAKERQMLTARQQTELDSLNLVSQGQGRRAQELYGTQFLSQGGGRSNIGDFSEEGKKKFSEFYKAAK